MLIFKITKYLILDLCIENFFKVLVINTSKIDIDGEKLSIKQIAQKYYRRFKKYLFDTHITIVTPKTISKFFSEEVKIYIPPNILRLVSDEIIFIMLFEGQNYGRTLNNLDE